MGFLSSVSGIGSLGRLFGGDKVSSGYDQAIGVSREMSETARRDLAPYREFGQNYLAKMRDFYGNRTRPTAESVKSRPGYQFRLNEGTRNLDNSAIAKGGLLSGNHLRDVLSYGQDYASNEYDKEVTRDEGMYQNDFARLMNLINLGYGAAGGSAGISQNTGNSLAQLYTGRGQAEADIAQFPFRIGGALLGGFMGRR